MKAQHTGKAEEIRWIEYNFEDVFVILCKKCLEKDFCLCETAEIKKFDTAKARNVVQV